MRRCASIQGPGEPAAPESQNGEGGRRHAPTSAALARTLGRWAGDRAAASERFQLARTEPSPLGNTLRAGVLVDVLLLRIVDAHKRFDGFDDALPVPDQVTVGVVWAEPISEAGQEPRHVQNLAMGAAHCEKAIAVGKNV